MSELLTIQQTLKAPKGQFNGFGKYKYRSCEDILEALKEPLKAVECYLIISDSIELVGDRYYVKATATLKKDGKELDSVSAYAREALTKKGMDDSQITGGASSYARKYALNGLFAIDDTKDSDTNENAGGQAKEEVKKEALLNDQQLQQLYVHCTIKDDSGALAWSHAGLGIMKEYKVNNLSDIQASKFPEVMAKAYNLAKS